jgi:subtilisin
MIRLPYFEVLDVMAQAPPPIPYGVKMIGAELEWPETKGKGVKVAVLDTGRPNHPDIKVAGAVDFTGSGPEDRHGHSTHCCGIIAANGAIKGVAPECELYTVKVLDDKGSGNYGWIVEGIHWCINNGMHVISMSLGGPKPADGVLHNAIQHAYASGITIITAAGNSGEYGKPDQSTVMYPAVYPECLAVTAVDIEKQRPEFSSRGVEAELAAAGVAVYSTYLDGKYAKLSGTSMACPHIAGAVALMIAKRRIRGLSLEPAWIRDSMAIYADDLGLPGHDWDYGYGLFSFGRIDAVGSIPDRPAIDLRFEIGSKFYWKDGKMNTGRTAPVIISDRAFLGLRDVGEALGCQVDWIPPKTVVIKG